MPGLSDLAPMPEPIDARPVAQRVARRRRVQGAVTLGLAAALVTALVIVVPRLGGTTSTPAGTSATPSAVTTGSNHPSVVQRTAAPSTQPWTTAPIVKPGQQVAGAGIISEVVGSSDGMVLCNGWSESGGSAACVQPIPLSGLTWDNLPGHATETQTPEPSAGAQPSPITQKVSQFTVVEGTWDGQRLQVTAVVEVDTGGRAWMTAYGYPDPDTFADAASFCTPETATADPQRGDMVAGYAAAEKLSTFEAGYYGPDEVLNIFVTQDVPGATQAIRAAYTGPLCVGLGRGVTKQQSTAATDKLFGASLGVISVGAAADQRGVVIDVGLLILTEEIHQQALTLAGPAAPALRFGPALYPIP